MDILLSFACWLRDLEGSLCLWWSWKTLVFMYRYIDKKIRRNEDKR